MNLANGEAHWRQLINHVKEIAQQIIKEADESTRKFFYHNVVRHLSIAQRFLEHNGENLIRREDYINLLLSRFFLDNLSLLSTLTKSRFYCQLEDNSCWDVEVLPSESFQSGNFPLKFRSELFYGCLKVGDVLNCKVRNFHPEFYYLMVINKCGNARVLHDCGIIVQLPRTENEEFLLNVELGVNEFVRVAVSDIKRDNEVPMVTVTVDEMSLENSEKYIKLGRINENNENELPLYVRNPNEPKEYRDLSTYLKSSQKFKKPNTYNSIMSSFGLDPKKIYSFYEFSFGSTDQPSGQQLLQAAKREDLTNFLNLAENALNTLNYAEALTALEEALKLDPKCVKAYEIRACVNAKIEETKISKKSIKDIESIVQLNSANSLSPFLATYMAESLLKAAFCHCSKNQFETAARIAEQALLYDKENKKIQKFLHHFKKAHPECFAEDIPLNGLEQKKQELVTQLSKISMFEE